MFGGVVGHWQSICSVRSSPRFILECNALLPLSATETNQNPENRKLGWLEGCQHAFWFIAYCYSADACKMSEKHDRGNHERIWGSCCPILALKEQLMERQPIWRVK
jgi:hypothetical protein